MLTKNPPRVVVARQKLADGYSDDVFAALRTADLLDRTKTIILLGPGVSSTLEARQIALGADGVQRDPVRADVLAEYIAKFRGPTATPRGKGRDGPLRFAFAGATFDPLERILRNGNKAVQLTPREVELVLQLHETEGKIATYDALYSEIFGRKYRGETSNLRVLLGRLDASLRAIGLALRDFVEVIPKIGYRYHSTARRVDLPSAARFNDRSSAA
ncbi:MAG TPA: winged helix-turn-helix domain-containing protein [Opitutaceae bacterium]|nr:winged helix-turn-helix domain-containing protein [Opitutaceae bacterium]